MNPTNNYTYILTCKDNTLYTGWTNDLEARIKAHDAGKGAKYTRGRGPVTLSYFEVFPSVAEAMRREAEIKKLTRQEKLALIQKGRATMKLISWNVNGLRASLGKGFMDTFQELDADIFCLQETKMERGQAEIPLEGYYEYWNSAEKKGYSGTAVFSKKKALSEHYGIGVEEHDKEGRVITLEFDAFYLVNCYTPNSQRGLTRLEYRMKWESDFLAYLKKLDQKKPIVLCGDLNVAHTEKDIKNATSNRKNAGFTEQEREKMTALLDSGFVDSYRYLNPDKTDGYTWWSYFGDARSRNVGWRIDYFIVSKALQEKISATSICPDVFGSDHCPVGLELNF